MEVIKGEEPVEKERDKRGVKRKISGKEGETEREDGRERI